MTPEREALLMILDVLNADLDDVTQLAQIDAIVTSVLVPDTDQDEDE